MNWNYKKRVWLTALATTLALILIIAALWVPQIPRKISVLDTIFVLDITDSMNVVDADFHGEKQSRLAWAKNFTMSTIRDMPCGSKAGLAVFTEARSLILIDPVDVCESYHDLTQMLATVEPTMAWVRSSEVSKAVYTAIHQAKEIEPEPTIVMLTDGHESPPISETLFPKFDGKPGEIHGVLVGIGGKELLPIPKTNEAGEIEGVWHENEVMQQDVYASYKGESNDMPLSRTEHLSSQKKSHLETLANRVGFSFLSSPKSSSELIDTLLDSAEPRKTVVDFDPYPWFSAAALVLLLLVFFPYTLLRRKGRNINMH